MKKIITLIIVLLSTASFSQIPKITITPEMLKTGWTFVSPFIIQKMHDPLTKEIINNAIPKLIDQDVKAAAYEVTDAISRVKNVKVLNKDFLAGLETSLKKGVESINKQDYFSAVNGLISVVASSQAYEKQGILDKPETNSSTPVETVPTSELVSKSEVDKNVEQMIVGRWKDENSTFSLVSNGVLLNRWDNGKTAKGSWELKEGALYFKFDQRIDEYYILELTENKMTYQNSKGQQNVYHATKINESTSNINANDQSNNQNATPNVANRVPAQPVCEINKTGNIVITNNSRNPYDISIDGVYVVRIAGKSTSNPIAVNEGNNHKINAKQVSGFAMYPTQKNAQLNVVRCSNSNWQVP